MAEVANSVIDKDINAMEVVNDHDINSQTSNHQQVNGLDSLDHNTNLDSFSPKSENTRLSQPPHNVGIDNCNGKTMKEKLLESIDHINEELESLLKNMNIDGGRCGFTLKDFYKVALKFYKDKSGKAVHLSYEDNCYFVALSQQIIHGSFNPATAKTLGVLDVVGRDRRIAWQSLGNMSKDAAILKFLERLNNLTPTFKPYIEAILADHLEKERLKKEVEEKKKEEEELQLQQEEQRKREEEERRRQEETKRQIQEALNQQTFEQFKLYSEQQFPGNPEQQAVLIRQLQEQHYQQYMQQVYQQQLLYQQRGDPAYSCDDKTDASHGEEEYSREGSPVLQNDDKSTEEEMHVDDEGNVMAIAPAKVWTRKDIKDFKSSIKMEGGDSIIKIGHGETVTVRVPTHQDGSCLFWEFATDSYDIGFGIIFEWRKDAASTGVTVHVTDSDEDDEDEEEEEEEDNNDAEDVERVAGAKNTKDAAKHPQSTIIPVYRRDSHEEVYAGSHCYPGSGVYLLKFDNSYSLWRNKVLYYRVYYTQR